MNLERFLWGAFSFFNRSNCHKDFPNAQSSKRIITYHSLCHDECWIYHPPCCVILDDARSKAMTGLFLFFVFLVLSGSCGSPLGCSDNPLELPGHFSLFSVQQRKQKYINKQANFRVFFYRWFHWKKKALDDLWDQATRFSKFCWDVIWAKTKTKTNKGKGGNCVYQMKNSWNKT